MNKNHHDSHTNTHLSEKPFACERCARKFVTKSNLSRHLKTCSKVGKLPECSVCGKNFKTFENVKRHQLHAHRKTSSK